jgi:hypothetical protein
VHQCDNESIARHADRMTQTYARHGEGEITHVTHSAVTRTDARSVDVGDVALETEIVLDGEVLRGERLVDLDALVVGDRAARASEQIVHGRHRRDAHHFGRARAYADAADVRERLETERARHVLGHDQRCARAVVDAGRVAGGHCARLRYERRRQLLEIGHFQTGLCYKALRYLGATHARSLTRKCSSLSTTIGGLPLD